MENNILKKYVVGLVFDEVERVMLIKKNRPDWQKGFLNGVGGEIKNNEAPIEAMIRECKEESGLFIEKWHLYNKATFNTGVELTYFCTLVSKDFLNNAKSLTDEEIVVLHRSNINGKMHNDIRDIIIDFIARYELVLGI